MHRAALGPVEGLDHPVLWTRFGPKERGRGTCGWESHLQVIAGGGGAGPKAPHGLRPVASGATPAGVGVESVTPPQRVAQRTPGGRRPETLLKSFPRSS